MVSNSTVQSVNTVTAEDTFHLGEQIGRELSGGEFILLTGGLGAGKTVIAKGILFARCSIKFQVKKRSSACLSRV